MNGSNVNGSNMNDGNANDGNANDNKLYISVIILLCTIGLIFLSWFFYLRHNSNVKEIQCASYLILNDSTVLDSISNTMYSLMIRADRIEEDINSLQNKYQSEVNLMVDKANGWLAFWIGVITLVIGLMSIWQIYRQNKNESDFRRLEQDTKRNIDVKYSDEKARLNREMNGMHERIKVLGNQIDDLQQTLRASKLSSLMICLSSLPDPQMTSGSADKRHQMCVVLKNISKTFNEYVASMNQKTMSTVDEKEKAYLVLTIVKLAVVRTHGIFSDIHQNILIQHLLDNISNTNSEILDGKSSKKLLEQIKKIESELHSLLSILDR